MACTARSLCACAAHEKRRDFFSGIEKISRGRGESVQSVFARLDCVNLLSTTSIERVPMNARTGPETAPASGAATQALIAVQSDAPAHFCAREISAGRPRASDLQAREERLLDAAADLFMANGYAGTSLEMIAREARVAVRTIYVKCGGKAGLLGAVIARGRQAYATRLEDMVRDTRPLETVLAEFGARFLELISAPRAVALQRIVIAESHHNAELGLAYYQAGPGQTYAVLAQFFERADIAAQLRPDVDPHQLPSFLISCVIDDPLGRSLFYPQSSSDSVGALERRLALFLRAVLR
jgi:TetR/AcrR family transcriptional repressor of mexJK operon